MVFMSKDKKVISFAEALRTERDRIGWTRPKMEERTGIPAQTINLWERGAQQPKKYVQRLVLKELREVRS